MTRPRLIGLVTLGLCTTGASACAGVARAREPLHLLCGDLLSQTGKPAVNSDDLVEPAMHAEHMFSGTSLSPAVCQPRCTLAELQPRRFAVMHGGSYTGDGGAVLRGLAAAYEREFPTTRLGQSWEPAAVGVRKAAATPR